MAICFTMNRLLIFFFLYVFRKSPWNKNHLLCLFWTFKQLDKWLATFTLNEKRLGVHESFQQTTYRPFWRKKLSAYLIVSQNRTYRLFWREKRSGYLIVSQNTWPNERAPGPNGKQQQMQKTRIGKLIERIN